MSGLASLTSLHTVATLLSLRAPPTPGTTARYWRSPEVGGWWVEGGGWRLGGVGVVTLREVSQCAVGEEVSRQAVAGLTSSAMF